MRLVLLAAFFGLPAPVAVTRVRTDEPVVALTFDACATSRQDNGFDRGIWDVLKREQAHVTLFLGGRWIESHPSEAKEIAAEPWIEIGNHTWAHQPLAGASQRKQDDEIDRTEAAIKALGKTSVAVRPPFGEWDTRLARAAATRGLPLVLWDVSSADAGGHVRPPGIVGEVMRQVRPGSIVVFHINGRGPFTKDALPAILQGLRARGYRLVWVSELLALPGGAMVRSRPQRYNRERKRLVPLAVPTTGPRP